MLRERTYRFVTGVAQSSLIARHKLKMALAEAAFVLTVFGIGVIFGCLFHVEIAEALLAVITRRE